MIPLLLNQLSVVSAKLTIPYTGVWLADLDVDLDISGIVPTGKAVLTIGTTILTGTIDSRATSKFGQKAKVQLVGGGGGWDTNVAAFPFHSDVTVLSTQVFSVTAAEVGEVVVESQPPTPLGTDYPRMAGPASRVFKGFPWYVTLAGITTVGPRLPIPFNPLEVDILSWDGTTHRAELAADGIVQPGTVLVDIRFGTATVRDVEQTFSAEGSKVIAWCNVNDLPLPDKPGAPKEPSGNRLARALSKLAVEAVGVEKLRRYTYRVIIQHPADGRVDLQLVDLTEAAPAFLTGIAIWPGLAGASAKLVPGTQVLVGFADDKIPVVLAIDPKAPPPLEIDLKAVITKVGLVPTGPVAMSAGTVAAIQGLIVAVSTALGANPAGIAAAAAAISGIPSTSLEAQ